MFLDDTQPDRSRDAEVALNVAITRGREKLYVIANYDYMTQKLPKDSLTRTMLEKFMTSETVIPITSLFGQKDADNDQALPLLISAFDQDMFWEQFRKDLRQTKKSLTIISAFISPRRIQLLLDDLKVLRENNVEINIYCRTSTRDQQGFVLAKHAPQSVNTLLEIGAKVKQIKNIHQKVAIIDDQIAWHGSLNILSHNDSLESMLRIEEKTLIQEIIQTTRIINTE